MSEKAPVPDHGRLVAKTLGLGGSSHGDASKGESADSEEGFEDFRNERPDRRDTRRESTALSKKPAKWNLGARATIRTTLGEAKSQKRILQSDTSVEDILSGSQTPSSGKSSSRSYNEPDVRLPLQSMSGSPNALEHQRDEDSMNPILPSEYISRESVKSTSEEEGELHDPVIQSNLGPDTSPAQIPSQIQVETPQGSANDTLPARVMPNGTNDKDNGDAKEATRLSGTTKMPSTLTLKLMPRPKRDLQRRYFSVTDSSGDSLNDNTVAICLICRKEGHDSDDCPSFGVSPFHAIDKIFESLLITTQCSACGTSDHLQGACPTLRRCSRCQNLGHQADVCTSKLKSSRPAEGIPCDLCGVSTHDPRTCESLWRTFAAPPSELTRVVQAVPIFCYVCGGSSHYGPECTMKPRGWTPPKSGWTFSYMNMRRYVDSNSVLRALDAPGIAATGQNHSLTSRIQGKHSIYISDEDDEEDHFLNPRITKSAPRGKTTANIRFAQEPPRNQHYAPPPPPPPSRHSYRDDRSEYERGYRPRSRSPPRYAVREPGRDEYRRPPPPPLPRGLPPPFRGRGGHRGRGRGSGGNESFRPLPSSGARAWRQHRI